LVNAACKLAFSAPPVKIGHSAQQGKPIHASGINQALESNTPAAYANKKDQNIQ